jgi:hypothetical protein
LGDWDQEDQGSKPARAKTLRYPISKITRAKWTRDVAQVVEHLLCKCKALSSNSNPTKRKKRDQSDSETLGAGRPQMNELELQNHLLKLAALKNLGRTLAIFYTFL